MKWRRKYIITSEVDLGTDKTEPIVGTDSVEARDVESCQPPKPDDRCERICEKAIVGIEAVPTEKEVTVSSPGSASTDDISSYKLKDIVRVDERPAMKGFTEGGVGRVVNVHEDDTYDVKFCVGGRTEKHIPSAFIHAHDVFSNSDVVEEHFALCEGNGLVPNTFTAACETMAKPMNGFSANFVRRSTRCPGRSLTIKEKAD